MIRSWDEVIFPDTDDSIVKAAGEAKGEDKQRAMNLLHGDEVETEIEKNFDESEPESER